MEKRIQKIINYYNLSVISFANEVGVSRSAISHIITARNKPSIEVLQKILQRFAEISTDWLLLGNGAMIKDDNSQEFSLNRSLDLDSKSASVEKIVIFYSNNTCKEYKAL